MHLKSKLIIVLQKRIWKLLKNYPRVNLYLRDSVVAIKLNIMGFNPHQRY